ncbi:MAG: flagellar hook-associated protein FlgK [Methyloversatilis sp.]|uniref:flagellar hook-associated protein FlgK n=1 Tax=Methyloversatilis sp. TaxID=2569862 RepID=UPI0027342BE8|nr:flagellar hook-associated protein FlgK [Methyloversatilis sp.]MDP2869633.1 flagellar hook-associated protein FlgK [Methyloversatilis sp.]
MGTQLYNIGITGLNAAQAGLITTGHNISNAATPGFTRQQVVLGTNDPQLTGSGFLGQGARIETVRRIYSQFLTAQVMEAKTQNAEYGAYAAQIAALDNLLADPQAGLSPAMSDFFDALQSVSASPTSLASRQSAISAAQSMTARFNALDARLEQIRTGLNGEISGSVEEINQLASQIARYNDQIAVAESTTGANRLANDMLDARERLITELNELVRVTQLQQSDGSINLFIGNGQPVVVGGSAFGMSASPSVEDASRTEVTYTAPGGAVLRLREDTITGGKLGGLLAFRRETLDEAQNALGRIAIGVAEQFNLQHALGQDLNGAMGTNVFNVLAGSALPANTNSTVAAALVNVTISNSSELTTSDYRLNFDGATYTLTRLSDNQSWSAATLGGLPPAGSPQGFTLDSGATTLASGDSFLIQPTRNGGSDIRTVIADPRMLALAMPISTTAALANTGNASISAGAVSSTTGLPLGGPITLTFDATTNVFNVVGGPGGTIAYNPATESAGKSFTFAGQGGFTFQLSGLPRNGDTFTISPNSSGQGDNRNLLELAALQNTNTLAGGTTGFQGAYAQMVASVGAQAREVQVNQTAQKVLLSRVEESQQSLSGVNLDEEAAHQLRYQQAYQAAGKMIELASRLFDTLLQIGR